MNRKHAFILAVLAVAAYSPTLRVGFIWDDHVIIEANTGLSRWSWQNLNNDFLTDNALSRGDHYFRPLQAISDRLDYSVWGLRPFGFHLTNLLFHIGNALLLYLLICRLGYGSLVAILASALFAVHPIDVEEFIVVSGRCTPMGFFFTLATLLLALEPGRLAAGLALGSCTLALLTKESSLMIPPLTALVFFARGEKSRRYWILVPMLALSALYLAARHHAVHQTIGALDPSLFRLFIVKVFPRVLFHYVWLIAWPWNLHNHRLIPHLSLFWPAYWLAISFWVIAVARTKNRTGFFCGVWFVLWFLPAVPSMINGGFMLDHWGYAVIVSLSLPFSIGVVRLWESRHLWWRRAAGGFYFTYIIALALLVHLNVALRGSDEKIYRWALHFTTSNPIKYNLGIYLLQTGRAEEALPYLENVRDVYPQDPNLALALREAYAAVKREHQRQNAALTPPVHLPYKKPKA